MPLIKRKQKIETNNTSQEARPQAPSTEHERRNHGRIIKPSALTVFARHPGLMGKLLQPDGIKVLDFSRFGLAFESEHKYRTGEELAFEISARSDHADGVIGFVTHSEKNENLYRCGVQFDFSANSHMRSYDLEEALTKIELNLLAAANH